MVKPKKLTQKEIEAQRIQAITERIREEVKRWRPGLWATEASPQPTCRCGIPRKPPGLMKHVDDDGLCVVHPDLPPQPWVRGYGGAR